MSKAATWSGVRDNIRIRIEQNKTRLAAGVDEDTLPILVRISHDDEQRLEAAEQWAAYHQS